MAMDQHNASLAPRPAELRALEVARSIAGSCILSTTVGRAQAAQQLAVERPNAQVTCWYLDQFQQLLGSKGERPANLTQVCQADCPAGTFDLALLPFSMHGEAELTRDLLQSAADRLAIGGKLVVATDNPKDVWLRERLDAWFKKVTRHGFTDAVVYVATKRDPLKKIKDYRCEFAFRDRGQLVRAMSRPGVFSHRHIDPGARCLLDAAEVQPDMRILDIGCGAGTVGLALAIRDPGTMVLGIDSNARAVQCTRLGADLNGLIRVRALLDAVGESPDEGTFDLAVANPPYYANFEIAERFVATAQRSLRSGGQLLLVTKAPTWYEEHLAVQWHDVQVTPSKRYFVVRAIRQGS